MLEHTPSAVKKKLGENAQNSCFLGKAITASSCFFRVQVLQCVLILRKYGLDRFDTVHFFGMTVGNSQVINTLTSHGSCHL